MTRWIAVAIAIAAPCSILHAASMQERIAVALAQFKAQQAEIYFPHLTVPQIPEPGMLDQAARALILAYPDPGRIVWEMPSREVLNLESFQKYLEIRKTLQGDEMVRWCVQQKLPLCQEFELRRLLYGKYNWNDSNYKRWNAAWQALAYKREALQILSFPLAGEWYILEDKTRHHRWKHWSAYAFDVVIMKDGRMFEGRNPSVLESYYAWNKPILAVNDGVVMQVEDKFPEVGVGQSGGYDKANILQVDCGAGVIFAYGHLKQHSAVVKVGQKVKQGDVLARVGNSGASGLPHLQFSVMDSSGFSINGLFNVEVLQQGKWILEDGRRLRERTYVRNAGSGK